MRRSVDVAVVGGGVIGCSVAYHAARRGASVELLEAREIGAGASGAAAGMLAAQGEAHEPGPFLDLLLKGREAQRSFGDEIREATGLHPGCVWEGTLRVAADEGSRERLRTDHLWQEEQGLTARWLEGDEVRELEPALSPETVAALHLPEDGQVDSPRLALALAAAREGARVEEYARAVGLVVEGSRVTGVRTPEGEVAAGCVVLAGGEGSAALAGGIGVRVPARPVKGQILSVVPRSLPVKANVWGGRCYVVPKRDGRVLIGATVEPGVHDPRPTLGGLAALCGAAVDLVPALSGATFATARGGLRPGTPDGLPIFGPVEGQEGLIVATGHYRNGVLLAPITGEAVSALALGEGPPFDLSPFVPGRFAGVTGG